MVSGNAKKPNSSKELQRTGRNVGTLDSTPIAEIWEKYFPYVPSRGSVRLTLGDALFF